VLISAHSDERGDERGECEPETLVGIAAPEETLAGIAGIAGRP